MSVLKLLEKRNLDADELESSDEELLLSEEGEEEEEEKEEIKEESAFKEPEVKEWKNRCRVLVT